MTKRKKSMPTFGEQITQQILENYELKDAQDIQDALKQVFGPIFEAVLKGEMQNHLGYEKNGHSEDSTNARNGYSQKTLPRWAKSLFVSLGTVRASLNLRL